MPVLNCESGTLYSKCRAYLNTLHSNVLFCICTLSLRPLIKPRACHIVLCARLLFIPHTLFTLVRSTTTFLPRQAPIRINKLLQDSFSSTNSSRTVDSLVRITHCAHTHIQQVRNDHSRTLNHSLEIVILIVRSIKCASETAMKREYEREKCMRKRASSASTAGAILFKSSALERMRCLAELHHHK